jgi:hypothetical protein
VNSFDPNAYGPVFAPLLDVGRRRPLDAGHPSRAAALKGLSIEEAFAHVDANGRSLAADRDLGDCCVAAVWLMHDFLDESHSISQRIDTPEGSYWHAIMHRREGDFSNAKYWYRRVEGHPVLDTVGQRLAEFAYNLALGVQSVMMQSFRDSFWNPFEFVDLCEFAVREKSYTQEFCLDVQQVEWEALFNYCYHAS